MKKILRRKLFGKKMYGMLTLGLATSFTASCACSANAGVENIPVDFTAANFSAVQNPFYIGTTMETFAIQAAEYYSWDMLTNNYKGQGTNVLTDSQLQIFHDYYSNGRTGKANNSKPWLALRWVGVTPGTTKVLTDQTKLVAPTWDNTKKTYTDPSTADGKTISPVDAETSLLNATFYAYFDWVTFSSGNANWQNPGSKATGNDAAIFAGFATKSATNVNPGLAISFSLSALSPSAWFNDTQDTAAELTNQSLNGLIKLPADGGKNLDFNLTPGKDTTSLYSSTTRAVMENDASINPIVNTIKGITITKIAFDTTTV